jgi:chromosomal replication initiation ATPase DnaA
METNINLDSEIISTHDDRRLESAIRELKYNFKKVEAFFIEINEKITNTYTKEEIDDVINGLTDEIEEKLQNNVNNHNIQL